jgi:hypothetical protein
MEVSYRVAYQYSFTITATRDHHIHLKMNLINLTNEFLGIPNV